MSHSAVDAPYAQVGGKAGERQGKAGLTKHGDKGILSAGDDGQLVHNPAGRARKGYFDPLGPKGQIDTSHLDSV